jgi:hypothetical protein
VEIYELHVFKQQSSGPELESPFTAQEWTVPKTEATEKQRKVEEAMAWICFGRFSGFSVLTKAQNHKWRGHLDARCG